jgi:hypothetical protein
MVAVRLGRGGALDDGAVDVEVGPGEGVAVGDTIIAVSVAVGADVDVPGVARRVCKIGTMKCPNCEEKEHQHKNGKTQAGSQRYRCYGCGCSYTPEKKVQGYGKAFRQKAIKMYIDGSGLRRTVFITRQWQIGQKLKPNTYRKPLCLLKSKPPSLTRFSHTSAIKKPHLSYYACRSSHQMHSGLEGGLGTFASRCASHRRPCP